MNNSYREIGSEYSNYCEQPASGMDLPEDVSDYALTFSGRTAIETVLKNLGDVRKAALPSYCCDSMLVPFRDRGIEVVFYPVFYDGGFKTELDVPTDIDVLLWCDYFGYSNRTKDLSSFRNCDVVIIEDITHSLYTKDKKIVGDYLVASLRKWEPLCCGGYCAGVQKRLEYKPSERPPETFTRQKKMAMELKTDYLSKQKEVDKSSFLRLFSESNEWLAHHYTGLGIDPESEKLIEIIDADRHRMKRMENARILHEGLKGNSAVRPMFDEADIGCPLFVPVIIEQGRREEIRKKLIDNDIYCPVHWPRPNAECASNLYDIELSLVCDHRYDVEDMNRIIEVINKSLIGD